MLLRCRFMIPHICNFQIFWNNDSIFIEPPQIELCIAVTMLRGTFRPIKCLCEIFLNPITFQIEISHLTFRQRISLFCKFQMSCKTQFISLCVPILFNQRITFVKFFTRSIVIRHFHFPQSARAFCAYLQPFGPARSGQTDTWCDRSDRRPRSLGPRHGAFPAPFCRG